MGVASKNLQAVIRNDRYLNILVENFVVRFLNVMSCFNSFCTAKPYKWNKFTFNFRILVIYVTGSCFSSCKVNKIKGWNRLSMFVTVYDYEEVTWKQNIELLTQTFLLNVIVSIQLNLSQEIRILLHFFFSCYVLRGCWFSYDFWREKNSEGASWVFFCISHYWRGAGFKGCLYMHWEVTQYMA